MRRRNGAMVLLIARELGDAPFCSCGATLLNYDTVCRNRDDDGCEGWRKLSEIARQVAYQHALPR